MTNWIKYAQWEESQKEIQRFELYKTAFMSIMPQLQLESTVFVKLKMPYDVLVCNSFFRARSVFERGLDVDHRNITVWLKYAEMEMRYTIKV